MPLILGIETSCDETAAAVVDGVHAVRSSIVASQHETHAPFGGVVPELAARDHVERIDSVVGDALVTAGCVPRDLDAVAVTVGPGLAGALLVGVAAAKGFALAAGLPLVAVNHLEAHIASNRVEHPDFGPPAVVLLVSGGHTLLARLGTGWAIEVLGETVDDAVGEAYDKVARYLGLGYPGGPVIDSMAGNGVAAAFPLPRAMLDDSYDFSFSGLKTAVVQRIRRVEAAGETVDDATVAAGFQEAAVDVLVTKACQAVEGEGVPSCALAGGVAANSHLRARLDAVAAERGFRLFVPSPALCADNAAMVAAAADPRVARGDFDSLDMAVFPSLRLGEPISARRRVRDVPG
ncbi:MAG: tRNA (adenosine(37)-N6)-threonylcarbamoyltransferase complex transferase subunit TsaD [Acidimicrobiia bacterium]|nr:tRNA (adenosine(37)-N6)-threonylcarbamoyltransferase complex transferase subunit TsaD [Acidimicrobiia bacterium]